MSTLLNGDLLSHLSLLVSLQYLGKHEPRYLVFSVMLYTEITLILLAISSTFINQFLAENSYRACTIISLFNLSCPYGITSLIGCKIAKAEMTHFQRHCLLVNIPFTKEDNILIKNLFELKGYNARHIVREFPRKS